MACIAQYFHTRRLRFAQSVMLDRIEIGCPRILETLGSFSIGLK